MWEFARYHCSLSSYFKSWKKKHVNILKKIIKSKDLAPLKKNLKNHRTKISVTFLEKWDPSKKHLKTNCSLGTVKLASFKKLFSETKKVKELHREIRKLKNKLISSESAARKLASKLKQFQSDLKTASSDFFYYKNLKQKSWKFHYLYGLPVEKILECLLPHSHVIK